MLSRLRSATAPLYLFACLILGGSAQGVWQNMALQLAGVAIIGWAASARSDEPLAPAAKLLFFLAIAAVAVIALQMVPLPGGVWTHLPARQRFANGFAALGIAVPSEPLSLTPFRGLDSLLAIIPPIAIFCAMVRLKAYRPHWLVVALVAGTVLGIVLGTLQVASSNPELSSWYLYEDTNYGKGVGFFANADHMATLLIITIPFLAAVVASAKGADMQRYSAILAITAGLAIVVLVGLALNGSLAGYGLALPVIAASALVILPPANRLRIWIVALALLLMVGAVAALETSSIGSGKVGEHATSSVQSRADLLSTTARAARDFLPFGSGLGSFRSVYPLYEDPQQVSTIYVVHAHNDYVELALELGFAGIVLVLLFFGWWAAAVRRTWGAAGPFSRAATIASAAILVHSAVDFPLRTAAIAACFGMCLAMLADSRAAPPEEKAELRTSRHVRI